MPETAVELVRPSRQPAILSHVSCEICRQRQFTKSNPSSRGRLDEIDSKRASYDSAVGSAPPKIMRKLRFAVALVWFAWLFSPILAQSKDDGRAVDGSDSSPADLYNPVADPKAVITVGHARFTVLTPQLIRMEWAADGKFEDRASLVFLNRKLPVPEFSELRPRSVNGQPQGLRITTNSLSLAYLPASDSDGKFTADNLSVTFKLNGNEVTWRPGMPDTGNLQGTTRTLDGALGNKTKEPIEPGLISRSGWVVVDDSKRPLFDSTDFRFLDGENSQWPWVLLRPDGERQDWYFFGYRHDYKQALADFIKVAGPIPLPPRFAFGAWWSRYWAYADQELDDLVRGFREDDVPLDVLVIDMEWHKTFGIGWYSPEKDQSGHTKGWTGYSWNRLLFPYPEQFLSNLHKEGLKVTLNLHPASGVQPWEDAYPEMARAMGIDPASEKYVPFDITNKKFATNYLDILHHPLEKQGVDFWWLDWQQEPNTQTPGVNPTWWLNYVHFTDQAREGKRPLLFHRWGGLGNHRYEIGFSGDTISVWESLAFQPWFTATAANVGYAYWSHDIGGHMPGVVDPELYTRWIQFGIFSPILRTHTTKNADAERRIWAYPEPYSGLMRDRYHERYALLPYIYTEARRTYDTGLALLHPLYYEWPEAPEAYDAKNEYLFGEEMLVDPVVAPGDKITGMVEQSVWIPPGDWMEVETGKHLHGPATAKRRFSIRQVPVYVRAGAIIPMAPPLHYSNEKPVDPLSIKVFPLADGQTSQYTLYEDAGTTRTYQQGQAAWTTISVTERSGELTVNVAPVSGEYAGMPSARGYEILLPADWPPESITVNGKALAYSTDARSAGWRFDGNTLTTTISVPSSPVNESVSIVVRRSSQLMARRAELDDFAGTMTRLREAYDTLQQTWPTGQPPDDLVDAMQTGDRLRYHPELASEQIARLHALLPSVAASVKQLEKGATQQETAALAQRLKTEYQSKEVKDIGTDYQEKVARAEAAIADVSPTAK
jgi:alpha-glucosidase (family GH31 glycosyl hydrolase)